MKDKDFKYIRTPQAAEICGLSPRTLEKMRLTGEGPLFIRAGRRAVVYDPRDLEAWLTSNRHRSTSDEGATPT